MENEKVKFLLNWNHFGEHLSSCMTKLMTDSSYSDIIITTADKRMIYSHRFVLANSSKYFQRLFRHVNRQRNVQLVVALPEVKYEIFKILMNYMYKGETQVPHELLPSVIKAGQFLEIKGLVNLNENESSGNTDNSSKYFTREHQTTFHLGASGNDGKTIKKTPSFLRNSVHPRENSHMVSKKVNQVERKREGPNDEVAPKAQAAQESGKENRNNKLPNAIKCKNLTLDKKEMIQLPVKRKTFMRESIMKSSPVPSPSSSVSNESSPPKKIQKRPSVSPEFFNIKVKVEKEENNGSPIEEKENELQEEGEKITIKMEVPDDIEEVVYNELQCEFCNNVYTRPSDWVRHMTEQHADKGYQAYKDLDKSVGGNAVITCVVCSSVCFSAAEWAKHLRVWHTERELTLANLTETKKTQDKPKKKTGLQKEKQ